MNPFEFVKQINKDKKDLMEDDPQAEKEYVPFVINKALSYEADCLMQANEMNQRHHLDKKLQFHYLINTIRARYRPSHKWIKPETNAQIDSIKILFECSSEKAFEILRVLTKEQLDLVTKLTDVGGATKKKK